MTDLAEAAARVLAYTAAGMDPLYIERREIDGQDFWRARVGGRFGSFQASPHAALLDLATVIPPGKEAE